MRAVSAKALNIQLLSTLLHFQRDQHLHEITQGVATLYPGLCAGCPFGATITNMSFRIRLFNFCTSKLYTLNNKDNNNNILSCRSNHCCLCCMSLRDIRSCARSSCCYCCLCCLLKRAGDNRKSCRRNTDNTDNRDNNRQ